MIRTLLISTALLAASGAAQAHGGYVQARVVSVEPQVSISFGTGYYDGFRVLYESGGRQYWTTTPYYPGPVFMTPAHHHVRHVHHVRYIEHDRHRHDRGDHRRDWRDDRDHRRHH